MNPVASAIEKELLLNRADGKAALGEMNNFLTNVWTIGFSTHNCFIKGGNDDSNTYQNTTKWQKHFASEAGSYKKLSRNKSLFSISMTRMWLCLPWDTSINYQIKWFGWSLVFSPKTTLDTSALTNYLSNLESHSTKHCHSTMLSLGVITNLRSTEKGRWSRLLKQNHELQMIFESVALWRYIWWHQINHQVLCVSNVWKKENELSQSSLSKDLCYKVQTKKGSISLNQNQAKKLDSSIMPPCSKVLHQKVKWCMYDASIWTNSLSMEPTPNLISFGWTLDEDKTYCIIWFEGHVAPNVVEVIKDDSCTGYGEISNSKIRMLI